MKTQHVQSIIALTILAFLTGLMTGCNEPAVEAYELVSPATEATIILPSETRAITESMPVTETLEISEAANSTFIVPAEEPIAEKPLPDPGADEEAPAAVETAISNWEEGRITFKSPSLYGALTASGEPFDKNAMTAAHKDLPFGTVVTVTNLFNGKQTTVTVNDRLPAHVSAILDLSPAAAEAIDMIDAGIVDGRIEW